MKLIDEFKAERARIDYRLKEAGIRRERFLLQTHMQHLWHDFWHAVRNVLFLGPLKETTAPGASYRSYELI